MQARFDLVHEIGVQIHDMLRLCSHTRKLESEFLVVDCSSRAAEQAVRVDEQSHRSLLDDMSW